jgi:hypothetical protein
MTSIRRAPLRRALRTLVVVSFAAGALPFPQGEAAAATCAGTTYEWRSDAPNGDWSDASNWTPSGVPDTSTECAVVTGDTVGNDVITRPASSLTIEDLTLSFLNGTPTITGSSALTIGDELTWNAGRFVGSGRTELASGADGTVTTGDAYLCEDWILRTASGASLAVGVGASMTGTPGSSIENAGTLTIVGNDPSGGVPVLGIYTDGSCAASTTVPSTRLTNTGTVRKSGGGGSAEIAWRLDNDGTVGSTSGTLALSGGSLAAQVSKGSFGAVAPAAITMINGVAPSRAFRLGGGARLTGGVSVGDGTTSGMITVEAGTATATGDNAIDIGQLRTGSSTSLFRVGTPTTTGTLRWVAGPAFSPTIDGSGSVRVGPGSELVVDGGGVNFSGGTIGILAGGVATVRGDGYIAADGGTTFAIDAATLAQPAGELDIQNDRGYFQGVAVGSPQDNGLVNGGVIRKSAGTGRAIVDAATSGCGRVIVTAGSLEFWGLGVTCTVSGSPTAVPGSIGVSRTLGTGTTEASASSLVGTTTPTGRPYAVGVTNRTGSTLDVRLLERDTAPAPITGYTLEPYQAALGLEGSSTTGRSAAILLRIDAARLVPGSGLAVFSDGAIVPSCPAGVTVTAADPDPCIESVDRNAFGEGDAALTLRTVNLSSGAPMAPSGSRLLRIRKCCARAIVISEISGTSLDQSVGVAASGFSVASLTRRFEQGITWTLTGTRHLVAVPILDVSQTGGTVQRMFSAAGTYMVADTTTDASMSVRVPLQVAVPSGAAATSDFTITWATDQPQGCPDCTYRVRFRYSANGQLGGVPWTRWAAAGVDERQELFRPSAAYGAGTYEFSARTCRSTGCSGWSPAVRFTAI